MIHRVAQQHRLRLGKIAVVEYQQEFAAIRIQALDRMRDATREEPQIVFLGVGDKTFSLRIDDTARYWGPSEKLWPELFAPPTKTAIVLCRDCREVAVSATE